MRRILVVSPDNQWGCAACKILTHDTEWCVTHIGNVADALRRLNELPYCCMIVEDVFGKTPAATATDAEKIAARENDKEFLAALKQTSEASGTPIVIVSLAGHSGSHREKQLHAVGCALIKPHLGPPTDSYKVFVKQAIGLKASQSDLLQQEAA